MALRHLVAQRRSWQFIHLAPVVELLEKAPELVSSCASSNTTILSQNS